ncbi:MULTISPECIES: MBL fold metallo-hydrolase [unclassified Nocardia]|uniref:MBL fold metallo-hydrolase n=1 Tax=unclassified Nocardia TaxID=2637762 RepID=UPI0024A940E1|nr:MULTISPECIES: MBL fold metallo-hydrolase [unclassified Nocardia]
MKIHHLNCGSMAEIEATYDVAPAPTVNHCLLVETADDLVLIETGLGLENVRNPAGTLDPDWVDFARPALDEQETAIRQIERLGYSPGDVGHIILTHLDVDHSGGLPDFPHARVHVHAAELATALAESAASRYRPAHWAHGPTWVSYTPEPGDEWFGFTSTPVQGLSPDFRLVPLGGHTPGHTGVAVRHDDHWLLHCGDAFFYHRELDLPPQPHPLLDLLQQSTEFDRDLRLGTQARLRELLRTHPHEVTLLNAHDPWQLQARQAPAHSA